MTAPIPRLLVPDTKATLQSIYSRRIGMCAHLSHVAVSCHPIARFSPILIATACAAAGGLGILRDHPSAGQYC
jgi:hypothetical protein